MRRRVLPFLGVSALIGVLWTASPSPAAAQTSVFARMAMGAIKPGHLHIQGGDRLVPTVSAGTIFATGVSPAQGGVAAANAQAAAGAQAPPGVAQTSLGCSDRNTAGINARVNQDCSYRQQGEEVVKFNPASPQNLIAGMNDLRQGFNLNAFGYSFDGGRTWGDDPPPYYHKINDPSQELPTAADPNSHTLQGDTGNGFTYDGGSDPAVAVDLEGRAFYANIIFDRFAGFGGAVVVALSPQGAGGSFYNDIAPFSRQYVVEEDNSPAIAPDKEFVTADIGTSSPNRDNVYITWTIFKADPTGTNFFESPIYGSMSTDHGKTWSTPEQISGVSPTLCFFGNAFNPALDPHSCNFDQGSDPVTLANGDLEVIFNNGNTAANNPNGQQLGVHCRPGGSSPAGTAHLNCAAPAKVGNDVTVGEPVCNFGRGPEECIPGTFVRTNDFPRIAVNRGNGHLYATWQDYRTGAFDVHLSQSTDGGATWTEAAAAVNPDRGKDHYEAAIDVTCSGAGAAGNPACPAGGQADTRSPGNALCPAAAAGAAATNGAGAGDHVAVSYYRTCQVANETEPAGCAVGAQPQNCIVFAPGQQAGVQAEPSDYSLSGGNGLRVPFGARPVSPIFQPPDGVQKGFMGDYSGLTVVGEVAHPIWSDQRVSIPAAFQADQGATRDEDVFITAARIPDGFADNQER
jgi:hypothetical protein